MLVDVLVASMRRDNRTFDAAVHAAVVAALCRSLAPALTSDRNAVKLFLPGPAAALSAQQYLVATADAAAQQFAEGSAVDGGLLSAPPVEIAVLGAGELSENTGALVVVDPTGEGAAVGELRSLVRSAFDARAPVLVLNHPQPGSVHEIAGVPGELPLELDAFEKVFTLAPFAIRTKEGPSGGGASRKVGRFVLRHSFPTAWELWRQDEDADADRPTPGTVSELLNLASSSSSAFAEVDTGSVEEGLEAGKQGNETYALCKRWPHRPSEIELFAAVSKASQERNRM
jgi:hypothetical protein